MITLGFEKCLESQIDLVLSYFFSGFATATGQHSGGEGGQTQLYRSKYQRDKLYVNQGY